MTKGMDSGVELGNGGHLPTHEVNDGNARAHCL